MPVHMIDSKIYGNAWGTDEMRTMFDEIPRTQAWLEIISSLAEAQAEVGLIPSKAVPEIIRICDVKKLDMDSLRKEYDQSGHSMHGLIQELPGNGFIMEPQYRTSQILGCQWYLQKFGE